MSDYISREEAINAFCIATADGDKADWCVGVIQSIPAANVREVVKAVWEWNDNNGYYYCGNCTAVSPREDQDGEYIDCPNYCPNCGADMRGEEDV